MITEFVVYKYNVNHRCSYDSVAWRDKFSEALAFARALPIAWKIYRVRSGGGVVSSVLCIVQSKATFENLGVNLEAE